MIDISSVFPLLQAGNPSAPTSASTASGGGFLSTPTGGIVSNVVLIGLLIVVFYFFLIRPQSKKQKETEKMLKNLSKGDKVVTIGGVHGTISSVKETTVVLKVDDNCKIEFLRSAIASVTRDKGADEKASDKTADKSSDVASNDLSK